MKIGIAATEPSELAALRRAAQDGGVEVAWVATSALELAAKSRADAMPLVVVTQGPRETESWARALRAAGTAVVICARDDARDVDALYRAIQGGGIEVARMPSLGPNGALDDTALVSILARHARSKGGGSSRPSARQAPVLAIGASAGGPEALAEVLSGLAADLPLRVIVAQHIDPPFVAGLASWLATRTRRRVEVADEGRELDVDCVLVVRSDRQPTVDARGCVRYRALDPSNPFQPCIDGLLSSLAAAPLTRGAAALLTGMGSDGAAGLLALRDAGWVTIAQDAASSRVFGMPRAAVRLGAASHVVALDRIGALASRALAAEPGARP